MGGGEVAGGVGEEDGAGEVESVEKEEFGVAGGVFAELRVGCELGGGGGEGFAEGHGWRRWVGYSPLPRYSFKVFTTNDIGLDFRAGPD